MIDKGTLLRYYKRPEIADAIVSHAEGKEIGVRFDTFFGKRPDVLKYPSEILELVKNGATSFHCSEERWQDPLRLAAELKKKELDELRIGWDLILDVDCPDWDFARIITDIIIRALKEHKVTAISAKFSGNKGFHVGVPYEAFPEISGKILKNRFPDETRIISQYIVSYIEKKYADELNKMLTSAPLTSVAERLGISTDELYGSYCTECGTAREKKETKDSVIKCIYCGRKNEVPNGAKFFQCKNCSKLSKVEISSNSCKCGNNTFEDKWNIPAILGIDAILISSRHMYRMPYSLHEKSGLASIPVALDGVRNFDKCLAEPSKVYAGGLVFLPRDAPKNDAEYLFESVFKWYSTEFREKEELQKIVDKDRIARKTLELPTSGIAEEHFPPCVKLLLEGITDGKKRALFILCNFLRSAGWEWDKIEERLMQWNEKNPEQLREVLIRGQVRYRRQRGEKVLPPNCSNKTYYVDMGICKPDSLCSKVGNPLFYAMRKTAYSPKEKKSAKKTKKSDDKKSSEPAAE